MASFCHIKNGEGGKMIRSELIRRLSAKQSHLSIKEVDMASRLLLEIMEQKIVSGHRIEIRGFGSFSVHRRPARWGRNPRTGDKVFVESKHIPHFRQGKSLHDRLNRQSRSIAMK